LESKVPVITYTFYYEDIIPEPRPKTTVAYEEALGNPAVFQTIVKPIPTPEPMAAVKPAVPEKVEEIFDIQVQPQFPGGDRALLEYVKANLRYPEAARNANIEGKVAMTFVVNKDGSISDINILRDIGGGCGQEAVRIISGMPKWIPGTHYGKPVNVRYTFPMTFKLD
jgi:periplasmic protein TonB